MAAPERAGLMPHRCDVFAVAGRCGVRLPPLNEVSRHRAPRESFARKTMKRIGRKHGEAHLELTLRLIVESAGNATALYGDVIWSVSELIAARPDFLDRGLGLYADFDAIDLAEVRTHARALRLRLPITAAMTTILALRLERPLGHIGEAAA